MIFHDVDGVIREHECLSTAAFEPEFLGAKLDQIRRFSGLPTALTVAEHSVLCAYLAREAGENRAIQAMCLTHDLAETFLGDFNGAHKPDAVREIEDEVNHILHIRGWKVPLVPSDVRRVKHFDNMAQAEERRKIWPLVYGEEKYLARPRSSWVSWVKYSGAYRP